MCSHLTIESTIVFDIANCLSMRQYCVWSSQVKKKWYRKSVLVFSGSDWHILVVSLDTKNSPTHEFNNTQIHLHTNSPTHEFTYTWIYLHKGSPTHEFTYTQIHLHTNSPTQEFTYIWIHLHINSPTHGCHTKWVAILLKIVQNIKVHTYSFYIK